MLKQLLDHAVALATPQEWPTYDGKVLDRADFLTSSEVASCLRQTYFSKQPGVGGAWRSNGFAERGHAIEAWFVRALMPLQNIGYRLEYMGVNQRSFYDPELGLSGTPDGLLTTPDGKKYLLEIKSIDPRTNKNNLPKEKHRYQVQQNMYLMQKCLEIELEGAILFYIDASNVFDVNEFFYTYDPNMIGEITARANSLWDAEEPDDLSPEGLHNGDCERCPFTKPCSATIDMQKALAASGSAAANFSASELSPLEGEALLNDYEIETINSFLYAKREAKEFTDQVELYKPDVQEIVLGRNGIVIVDGSIVTGTVQAGRETIDKELLKAAGLNPKDFTKTGKPFIVLNVKEAK